MKLTHVEMKTQEVAQMRVYTTPEGQHFPSITTMLGRTVSEEKKKSLSNWQNSLGIKQANKICKAAGDRGTNVHLLIERFLNKVELKREQFSQDDFNLFVSLKIKLNQVSEVWAQEIPLYSNMLQIAGRCDAIGVYKGIPSIIDFKTSTRLKSAKDIEDYKLQCTFYAIAANEMYETNIQQGVVLMAANPGFPLEFIFDLNPYVNTLADRVDAFYRTLNNQ
jgi:ATP-dependent exoDNAse (exonuclease V) beta subunit